jgi:hypothetical protein
MWRIFAAIRAALAYIDAQVDRVITWAVGPDIGEPPGCAWKLATLGIIAAAMLVALVAKGCLG